jgi:hypothetical protein
VWPVLQPAVGHEQGGNSSRHGGGELRVLLLNKSAKQACAVSLSLQGEEGAAASRPASLPAYMLRVAARSGGMAGKDVMFGGAHWADLSGRLTGEPKWEMVKPVRGTSYELLMPPASAALLVLSGAGTPTWR